mmetsp:Transcript_60693/g.162114  ORF Transcript_60693/g.162114 Transcript_60693/m.162114 type:complete len:103 (-) Transcript_60693:795-1103(-)
MGGESLAEILSELGRDSRPPPPRGDDDNGIRQFSAPFFARKLEALGATTLLRLADAGYDRAPFEEHGVAVRDLDFHGMSTPPAYTVRVVLASPFSFARPLAK